MDATTAFLIAMGFTLLNGAVLGFMRPALTENLKPSVTDWRIGTLLLAGALALFAASGASQTLWVLPIANALIFVGFALYARSIRRYVGRRETWSVFLPGALGLVALIWFTFFMPNLAVRVLIASGVNLIYSFAVIHALVQHRRTERSYAGAFLIGLLLVVAVLVIARVVYYASIGASAASITVTGNLVAALSPLLIAALPIVGTTAFALLCFERIRGELHLLATTDALTKLANRRTIAEQAARLFEKARQTTQPLSVAVIDIDHFKRINDKYGHDAGDLVLTRVAGILNENVRGTQLVGRQGGEEFVALFEDANALEAQAAAERLRAAVADATQPLGEPLETVTVSIGVATISASDASFDELLRRADRALYAAKLAGRNRVAEA